MREAEISAALDKILQQGGAHIYGKKVILCTAFGPQEVVAVRDGWAICKCGSFTRSFMLDGEREQDLRAMLAEARNG